MKQQTKNKMTKASKAKTAKKPATKKPTPKQTTEAEKLEGPTFQTPTPIKTVAAVAEVEPAVLIDTNALLLIDGEVMIWKSRTYIPGTGTVAGEVKRVDFEAFQKLLKQKSPTTDSFDWISNEDLQRKAKIEGRNKMKQRNGLS